VSQTIGNNVESYSLKSNGWFSILIPPYDKKQHPNQQQGLDKYVDVVNHYTGNVNSVKLYENKTGLYFKADGGTHYLDYFTQEVIYIPFQIIFHAEDMK